MPQLQFEEVDPKTEAVVPDFEAMQQEDSLSDEELAVDAPAASEEAFATSLLDSGEGQSLPVWMSDVTGEATPEEAFGAETLPTDALEIEPEITEEPWLSDIEAEAEIEVPEPLDASETPDWLMAAAPIAAAGAAVAATASDLPESAEDDESFEPVAEVPLELMDTDTNEELFDEGEVPATSLEAEIEPESEPELEIVDENAVAAPEAAEDNEYFSAFEDLPAAEVPVVEEPITEEPALVADSNAPDWLNAMVPGLDIDTSAGTSGIEDVLEEDLTDETADASSSMPDDYEWLNDMVEEETQSDIAVPAVAAQAPRFVFSRPPRWLRILLEQRDADAASDVAENNDLPAWLR